jgi:hypothetical protein
MLHLHRKKACIIKTGWCFLFGFILLVGPASAQTRTDLNLYDHDSKPYYFGITLGANLARFNTELHPRFLQYDSAFIAEPMNSGGFTLGLLATARISDRFQARFNPQLMFIERSIYYKLKEPDLIENTTDIIKKVESVTVSFPFQIKFQSDRIGNFRVYMLGGVKGEIDLASNARAKRADDLLKINKFDYGLELGIGFNFFFESFILSPEIKISNGLSNLHSRNENLIYSNVFDRIFSRMLVICIHIEG